MTSRRDLMNLALFGIILKEIVNSPVVSQKTLIARYFLA
jgi:hypothetical protein